MGAILIHDMKEHGNLLDWLREINLAISYQPQRQGKNQGMDKVWAFGLQPDGSISYYIGLDWLDEKNEIALRVRPKIPDLNYHAMFEACLRSPVAARHLGEVYDIRVESRFIQCKDDQNDFTPLLLHHYLTLLSRLVQKPLKKGYITRIENLQSKLKGKILIGDHIKANILGQKPTRLLCSFQEYTTDCPENRLLHGAYRIGLECLRGLNRLAEREALPTWNYECIAQTFRGIGILDQPQDLLNVRGNPLFPEYAECLRLAKIICRIQGYRDRHHGGGLRMIPPYVIDMSKLFELYVYHLLHESFGGRFLFQSKANYGATDFLDLKEQMVIDTKYKPQYENWYEPEDIRQVAGYARDNRILDRLGVTDKDLVVPCLIIFPDRLGASPISLMSSYTENRVVIKEFHAIWKLAVTLPTHPEGIA
jgi:5-methylcytosine-specific restriction enzyme subunit McrC